MTNDNPERKAVYAIAERRTGKPRWIRVGIAFPNRDGSMNVVLDAMPVNGKLHVRDFPNETPEDDVAEEPAASEPAAA